MGISRTNRFKLKLIDLSNDTTVAHTNGTNTQDIRPVSGKVYEIVGLKYSAVAPIGDTSGTHKINIYGNWGAVQQSLMYVIGNHSTTIKIGDSAFTGDSSEVPSGATSQFDTMYKGVLWCNYDNYLQVKYTNNTDVDQTGTRTLLVLVKEYNEVV